MSPETELTQPACVADLMTVDPLTLSPGDTLAVARSLMVSCRCRHLPVIKAGRICGIVSARDLVGVTRLEETRAGEVMQSPVDTVSPDTPIVAAAEELLKRRFSSLPVVDGSRLVGIITTTDLMRQACTRLGDALVSRVMTYRPLATVDSSHPIDLARLLMKVEHVRHLPVVDGDEFVGFLSDLDVLAVEPGSDLPAVAAMPLRSRVLSPEMRAADAGRLLIRDRLDALPVLRGRRLIGILSAFDFLHALIS